MSILANQHNKAALAMAFAALLATPALADGPDLKTLWEQQVGQWADARVAPETRTRCKEEVSGTAPGGTKWRGCKQWQTSARVMEMHSTMILRGPKDLSKPDKRLVEQCARLAGYSASQVAQPEAAAALAAAQTTFLTCASSSKIADPARYVLTIETRSKWSDWR